MRQMTFEVPDEVADQFDQNVSAADRSDVITQLILHRPSKPRLTDAEWEAACAIANADPDLLQLEKDWDLCAADGLGKES